MAIAPNDMAFIQKFVMDQTGNALGPDKAYLVEARLQTILTANKIPTLTDLFRRLQTDPKGPIAVSVLEAMMTTETMFFRDVLPFKALKVLIEEMFRKRKSKDLRIWSAAASTGQEAYSIAMLLKEDFPNECATWRISILATDINTQVLAKARAASYSQMEINRGLSAAHMVKYFTRVGTAWTLRDDIKKMIEFRQMNLCAPWGNIPTIDLLLLRNVMIYFDNDTRKQILARVRNTLAKDGYLFLGGAETTMYLDDQFERVNVQGGNCYRLKDAGSASLASSTGTLPGGKIR